MSAERKWTRDNRTGRLIRINDETADSNDHEPSARRRNRSRDRDRRRRQRSPSRSRSRSRSRARPNTDPESSNNTFSLSHWRESAASFFSRFMDTDFNEILSAPPPDDATLNREMQQIFGIEGARRFHDATQFAAEQMMNDPSSIESVLHSLLSEYRQQRQERQMQEEQEGATAVQDTDIEHLKAVLANIRPMIFQTIEQLNTESFTLRVTMSRDDVLTTFDNILVSRIAEENECEHAGIASHRKVSVEEEEKHADDERFECTICIDRFEREQWITTLECTHQFHKQCLSPWLKQKGLCPMCRGKVIQFKCTSSCGTVYV